MLKTLVLAAGLAVATFSAQAATMKAVYTSVVDLTYSTTDHLGGNAVLAGDHFTTTYVYDTNKGTRTTGPTFDILSGVSLFKSVTVEFKGWRYTYVPKISGLVAVITSFGTAEYTASAYGTDSVGSFYYQIGFDNSFGSSATNPANLEAPATAQAAYSPSFAFVIRLYDPITGLDERANGEGRTESVTISAVPLPASLPLLMAGFGGLAALRRRSAKNGTK